MGNAPPRTQDSDNVALFGRLAADWWDPDGQSKLLHRVNPARLGYIRAQAVRHFGLDAGKRRVLAGLSALDVGCGAGLVAEPLARMGATVDGLDAGEDVVRVAREHARESGLEITYASGEIAEFAGRKQHCYDLITCLEVVEHVSDIETFVQALVTMLKPGGLLVFSTPNRTPQSWAVLIAGAERLLKLIPDGGHDWRRFLTPDELTSKLAQAGLQVGEISGLSWSVGRGFHISDDRRVNYIGTATPA